MPTESTPPSGQALPAGTRLEEFEVLRVLGSGGFGITYLARDVKLGRQVVIKENLPAQFAFRDMSSLAVSPRHTAGGDADNFAWSLENFSRESSILASLDHPGIVSVMQSFEAFGTSYFVMPHVEGEALDVLTSRRKEDPYGEEELRGLLEHVLDALGYLHGKSIYHRDIKPSNILVTKEGVPILIDFGSARQRLSERSMTVVESAGYTPFEQLQSRGNVGPWSDLYSLGATVFKVITGEAPPKANDRMLGDPFKPLRQKAELRGRYSVGFLSSVDRALAVRVENRWQSGAEWLKAVEGGGTEEVRGEVAQGAGQKPDEQESVAVEKDAGEEPPRKKRVGVVLACAALVVALVVALPFVLAPKVGSLVVRTTPPGAMVLDVDGRELGVTPLELSELPAKKRWEGSLALDGYEPGKVAGDVVAGEVRNLPAEALSPSPQKVVITSKPAGAEVISEGKSVGTTPWEGPETEVGELVSYTLRRFGYEDLSVEGEIAVGEALELNGELARDRWIAGKASAGKLRELVAQENAYAQALLGNLLYFGPKEGLAPSAIEGQRTEGRSLIEASAEQGHPLGLALRGFVKGREHPFGYVSGLELSDYQEAVRRGLAVDAGKGGAAWWQAVGYLYMEGLGVAKDEAEALKWIRKAAEQGYARGQVSLGWMYANGRGVAKNEEEAVEWYRKAAEQDYAKAQTALGFAYRSGRGVAKDEKKAVEWYRKAAEQDYAVAQVSLGLMYEMGSGVTKNEGEAVKWYRKAAEQGNGRALLNLSEAYLEGKIGLKRDPALAKTLADKVLPRLRSDAAEGIKEAQYSLGLMYANDRGVKKDEVEALKWIRKAAEQGHAVAQTYLGLSYVDGSGVAKDEVEAVKWFRKAAAQDHARAQSSLGSMYLRGRGVGKDEKKALEWYRKAVEQGEMNAQYNLGSMYFDGHGVGKDEEKAVEWFRKAAEQDYALAQTDLGVAYATGRGVEKDEKKAVEWYRKAVEQDDAFAQRALGVMYETGRGVAKDEVEAVEWFRKAAEQGDARGQYRLGWMYAEGRGVEKDDVEAVKWYRKAVEQDYALAQTDLGVAYATGRGVAKDEEKAVEWYRKAAGQGVALAQNNLGWMYAWGRGVAKDEVEAVEWFRKAAEQGDARGQYRLGWMYAEGRGVEKDDVEAVKWYRKAVEQDYALAQTDLGFMYENGRGVAKDEAEAVKWYRKAAGQGVALAQNNLGWMYAWGRGVAKNDVEAVEWLRKAAEQGNARGQANLGWMYADGRGVAKNEAEAVKWFRKAAEQGNARGQTALGWMYADGSGVAQDDKEAVKWFRKAAAQGEPNAKAALRDLGIRE